MSFHLRPDFYIKALNNALEEVIKDTLEEAGEELQMIKDLKQNWELHHRAQDDGRFIFY